jgi:GNAT superfamily N-acetyltransferase
MADGKAPVWVRLVRVYREKGLGGVWFGVLSRIGYRRLVLLERRLDEPVIPVGARVQAEIRLLGPDDEASFVALGQEDAVVFRKRLEAGHLCWGAWCSGRLRHTRWYAFRGTYVEYLRCRLLLDDQVSYMYRSFTQPEYRGLGLAPATGSVCLPALRELGCRLVLAGVVPDNNAAFPSALRVGYRRIGVVRAVGAGRRPAIVVSLDRRSSTPAGWSFERLRADAPPGAGRAV